LRGIYEIIVLNIAVFVLIIVIDCFGFRHICGCFVLLILVIELLLLDGIQVRH